ncbi:PP2C family protein-serine/threonine phosphatase [Aeromicrobium stalagmiti]|uniref:PP2C family protein-serine/threonine phosphatase n=1 Tax=Aeromicrobium stalagmiti TaxID=2738988 RepID=UPI0015698689|nr:protein phosphatase 2C domain-containing protein [Aeromicrobium stalagmiti]NRQ49060.1 protein phosphatase 2C domain-containing protein [Aeromicrobium stalagmiti]
MTALTYRYVALTDTGLRRSTNQDSGYASDRLLVIADGMGGAAAGDLASSEAMHIIRQLDRDLDVDALDALEQSVKLANARLGELIRKDPSVEGMGTTLEVMLWDGEKFAVAHLGDSRAYRLREGTLAQISTDHTFVQSLVDEGKISPAEARVHPHRSLLLRALLGRDDNSADLSWLQPRLGDRYLLCSDGLTDMVTDDVIQQALAAETIDMAATELVRLALEAGGVDNVTVVIAEFVEKGTDPDEHLSSFDGQPQLVGAAAGQARPRTGAAASGSDPSPSFDPEELRYAPRPPGRRRWLRWTAAVLVVAGILTAAGGYAYSWSQDQYYVGAQDGEVVVFKGVDAKIPGLTLSHVDEATGIQLTSLSDFQRQEIEDGVEASSKIDALRTVADLDVATPTPTPTPTPTKKATPRATRTTAKSTAADVAWLR